MKHNYEVSLLAPKNKNFFSQSLFPIDLSCHVVQASDPQGYEHDGVDGSVSVKFEADLFDQSVQMRT